jgi:predicted metalloprotease
MKWEGREESQNVEDRRGMGRKAGIALGGGGLIILLLAFLLGDQNLIQKVLEVQQKQAQQQPADGKYVPKDPQEERMADFTAVILKDTEDVWGEQFRQMGKRYEEPRLVLYSGIVASACGEADSAVGPFYCPGDSRVYIDLSFYKDMENKLKAPGEFARAYVIAHEVGHHVQRLLGFSQIVDKARRTMPEREFNRMSVRLELQADFLAGVWAHHAQRKHKFLEPGDVESALNAAFQIGDDRLQQQSRGVVVRDSFTHGSSKQRMRWFQDGFQTGDLKRAVLLFEMPYDEL